METQLEKNGSGLHTAKKVLPATGRITRNAKGETPLALAVTDKESGLTADSATTLTKEGAVLRGTTTQILVGKNDTGQEESASVTYGWIAQKFTR